MEPPPAFRNDVHLAVPDANGRLVVDEVDREIRPRSDAISPGVVPLGEIRRVQVRLEIPVERPNGGSTVVAPSTWRSVVSPMTSAECPVRLRLKIIDPALTPTWTRFSSASRKPSAVFRSGGHVGLTWTLRPWPRAAGG